MKQDVLEALGGYPYRINTWIDLNENLFAWMRIEKLGMGLILLLIVLVAAFNIVSTFVVIEKLKEVMVRTAIIAHLFHHGFNF